MENLVLKIKLSMLWIITELITFHPIYFLEPGVIAGILAGEAQGVPISPEVLLIWGIMYLVPLLMVFLTLTVRNSINRAANLLVGIIYVGLSVIDLVDHLANPTVYGLLMRTAILIATVLIVWHAYQWFKREA